MNVVEISKNDAFKAGSEIWVIQNDSLNSWWQELDFRSGFLLSKCLYRNKLQTSSKIIEILEQTQLNRIEFNEDENFLLIGTQDHFLNKWIFLWNQNNNQLIDKLEEIAFSQKVKSIRFFSNSENILHQMETRPKTRFIDITFVENT